MSSSLFTDLLTLWIRPPVKTRGRARRRAAPKKKPDPFLGLSRFLYQNRFYPLQITHESTSAHACHLKAEAIQINLPSAALSPKEEAAEVALSLRLWVKSEAKRVFGERLAFWSSRLGVAFFRLVVTSPHRRWGSCTARNEIRLNWRLLQMPPALLDYVVAHEVCHIPHKNHGRAFWAELEKLMPDYRERRLALRAWEKNTEGGKKG
jgi:predicted metal-dependent hydrolase